MPILGIIASSFRSAAGPQGAYDALATVTVPSGGVASVTFAGIPTGYKHLQLRWINKSASNGSYNLVTFNSSTTGYADHYLYGNGASALAGADTSQSAINLYGSLVTSSAADVYAAHIVDILDYANTNKNKTLRALGGQDSNGSGVIFLSSGLWANTAAINSITITANTGNFTSASQFALYGVR